MNANIALKAKQLLEDQIDLVDQLTKLLGEEYQILNQANPDGLENLAGEKYNIVTQLEHLNRNWQDLLHALNTEFTLDGISRKMNELDSGKKFELVSLWEKLGELSRGVQQQNIVNGAVVTMRHQVTEQAMKILRGQTMGGSTYGRGGREVNLDVGGNTIAKA